MVVSGNARAKSARSVKLGLKLHRVAHQPVRGEPGKSGAKLRVEQEVLRRRSWAPSDRLIKMGVGADAAEMAFAGRDVCLQHFVHGVTQHQIGVADDPLAYAHWTQLARLFDDLGDKFGLADRAQCSGPSSR